MKKLLIVTIVLVAGIVGYLWHQSQSINQEADIAPADEATKQLEGAVNGQGTETFRFLMAKPGDLECAITATGPTTDTLTGTYFASNGLIRADVMVAGVASGTPESNVTSMVVTPDTLYTWAIIDGEGYGVKSIFEESGVTAAKPEPGKQTPIDFDGQVTYDCKPWEVVDKSIFEPPSTIIFKDYTTTLEAGMEDGTIYPETSAPALTPEDMQSGDPCTLCDKVAPGEGQDQCRVNFKCGR